MAKLRFKTSHGVCGHVAEWDEGELELEAHEWVEEHGAKIGIGSASLPDGGYIDLRQFATVVIEH